VKPFSSDDQRAHRPVLRIEGDERRLDFGQLHELPVLAFALHAHDRAAADAALRCGLGVEAASREAQAIAGDVDLLPGAQRDLDLLRVGGKHDRREQVVAVDVIGEQLVEVLLADIRRQLGVTLRRAVAVRAVVLQHALAQCCVGRFLVRLSDRRIDPEAAGIDLLRVLVGDRLAHHLRREFGVEGVFTHFPASPHRGLDRLVMLRCTNVAQLGHAPPDELLALLRALRVDDRVVQRRRLGQPGEHRALRERQLADGLVVVDLRSGAEAVGALSEVDLVEIQLQDLVLGQAVLDLEREQRLVQLSRERLFRGEKEVARHLHGDRARALAAASRDDVRVRRAHHADVVDPGVLVEALVLDRDDGVLQVGGDLGYGHHRAPFLAELADQHPVRRVDPQRNLGLVFGQRLEGRQVRVGKGDDQGDGENTDRRQPRQEGQGEG
jgi:hypothetical protein